MSSVLLTGGFGYIGSHTAALLHEENFNFHIVDNFSNCNKDVINRLERIINKKISYSYCDVRDTENLIKIIAENKISSVIHFAGLKSTADSLLYPLKYYDVNVLGTISLLNAMKVTGVKKLIFSSSATVYGIPNYLPIDENHLVKPVNPYGQSKLIVEKIMSDLALSDKDWSIISLRYFNPIGSHSSFMIGDDPSSSKSKNLMPSIIEAVKGIKKFIEIYGNDYDTYDGTGVRDYIHIMDLANAHIKSIDFSNISNGLNIFNIGTGKGFSVLEIIKKFEEVTGKKVPINITKRRMGDVPSCFADPTKANNILKWKTMFDLDEMCISAWEFSKLNY